MRKYLYKYSINDRGTFNKRLSTTELQNNLTKDLDFNQKFVIANHPKLQSTSSRNVKDYIYFHLKISNFKKMGWGFKELEILFNEFLKYKKNVIFTILEFTDIL